TISLQADSGRVFLAAPVSASGKSPGGDGGQLIIEGPEGVEIDGDVSLPGGGAATGGLVSVDSGGPVSLGGDLDVTGSVSAFDGFGGDIVVDADGEIDVTGNLSANAWSGGSVTLSSLALTSVTGSATATGIGGPGGQVAIESCAVSIAGHVN